MPKAEYEEGKFIVINPKHILGSKVPKKVLNNWMLVLENILDHMPDNQYYVCNHDEPYAQKVIDTILEGESGKT